MRCDMIMKDGVITRDQMLKFGFNPATIKAFENHFPDYEFTTFKPVYAPRYYYLMEKGETDKTKYKCLLESVDEVHGFMLGAIKVGAKSLKHNKNWQNET